MSDDSDTHTHGTCTRTTSWNEAWESGDIGFHELDVNR